MIELKAKKKKKGKTFLNTLHKIIPLIINSLKQTNHKLRDSGTSTIYCYTNMRNPLCYLGSCEINLKKRFRTKKIIHSKNKNDMDLPKELCKI